MTHALQTWTSCDSQQRPNFSLQWPLKLISSTTNITRQHKSKYELPMDAIVNKADQQMTEIKVKYKAAKCALKKAVLG